VEHRFVQEPEFENAELVQRLIDPDVSAERLWDEDELREVLDHQLGGSLVADLQFVGNIEALEAAQLCGFADPAIHNYRGLFEHPAPPEKLLRLSKRFAQAQLVAPEPQLPRRVAQLLYFTSIAVARLRCGTSISELPQRDQLAGIDWVLTQPWVDRETRALLQQARRAIGVATRDEGSSDAEA
jgi:hypothetical protein